MSKNLSELYTTPNEYKITKEEDKIISYAMDGKEGYSAFQMNNFVISPAITDYKKLKQALLEIESRKQVVETMTMECERDLLNQELAEYEIGKMKETGDIHPAEIKLVEMDLKRLHYDFRVNKKRLLQAEYELKLLVSTVADIYDTVDDVRIMLEVDSEEKEANYWVSRMAKQAAMDMVSTGRIGVGNMDAIAGMPEDKQVETLATALQYNQRLNIGMAQINEQVSQNILELGDDLPTFDVPSITDKLLVKLDEK